MFKGLWKIVTAFLITFGLIIFISPQSWAFVRGEVAANKVNIRTEASLSSDVLFMANQGQPVDILEVTGDFYKINLGLERNRYIAREYVEIVEIIGTVIKDDTPLMDKPPSEGGVTIMEVDTTFAVNIQFKDDEGYYIDMLDKDYFIEKDRLDVPNTVEIPIKDGPVSVPSSNFQSTGNTVDDIINYAKEYLGVKYRYGGSGPSGFDCSGFVSYVLKNFGVSVSRSSASMAQNGVEISRDQLRKCDLLFFATTNGSSRISHVGMYIGDGKFIHSSTWGKGVVITNLSDAYYNKCFVKARRVL